MKMHARLALILVMLLSLTGVASAAYTGPFYDTYVIVGGSNNPTFPAMYVQDSTGECTDTQIAYIQFDVSIIQTVTSASLQLTHASTLIGLSLNPTLTLYGVADFDPATLSGAENAYPKTSDGVVIQSLTIPSTTTAGTQITWGGADTGLQNYIQQQVEGDDIVTLAMSFSSGCNANNSQINFYSQEYATNPAYRPVLTIEGTSQPNSVALSTFTTDNAAPTWPLYAGLGALALIAAAGVAWSRRRAALR